MKFVLILKEEVAFLWLLMTIQILRFLKKLQNY